MINDSEGNVDFFEEEDRSLGADRFKAEITNLAREAKNLEGEIQTLQDKIKDLARRKAEIETKKLPGLLQEAGVKTFTTLEGITIETKFVVGSIPAESKQAAFSWLDHNGHSDIIKRNLALQFNKGQTDEAEKAAQQLRELGFDPTLKLDVHPQTFMAFAREQINNGKMLPLDQWGVFYGDKAVIK
jgi:hypothetical protein